MAVDPWEIMVRMLVEGPSLKDVGDLCTEVDSLRAKLFSLQTNHDDLAKWFEKHKDDAAKVEGLKDFIRGEGASAKLISWQAAKAVMADTVEAP